MGAVSPDNPIVDAYRTIGGNLWRWSRFWRDCFNQAVLPGMGFDPQDRYSTQVPCVDYVHTAFVAIGDQPFKWVLTPRAAPEYYRDWFGNRRKVKRSTHRVFVECPCGQLVPAGRVHQHICHDRRPLDS